MTAAGSNPRSSKEEVKKALGSLVRFGVEGLWTERAAPLLDLRTVTRGTAGLSHKEALQRVRENLEAAIQEVPSPQHQDLLRIVLGLDVETASMSAAERRAEAGRRFREGKRPVQGDTIRQYHEPQALEQLAAVLLRESAKSRQSRRRSRSRGERPASRVAGFGDPDAARVDPEHVLGDFIPIDFSGRGVRGQVHELDTRARLIIGRKGSGKTLYLRRLSLALAKNGGVYVDDVAAYPPQTTQVVQVGQYYPGSFLVQKWQDLWRVAILRSALSHLVHAPRLRTSLTTSDREQLGDAYMALGARGKTPRSIGEEMADLLAPHRSRYSLDDYLASPVIADAEYRLQEGIRNAPPLFFYVDGLDDEYQHAPYYWLQCQKGLFLQTMRLERDPRLSRLKVTVALRDVAYAAIVRTEHATRYADSPSVANLRWTPDLARGFLEAKVRRLDPSMLLRPNDDPTVSDWLGRETIAGEEGDRGLPLADFLVEHTRALPRDIVQIGNQLCQEVRMAKEAGVELSAARIRETVRETAQLFGSEQVSITATHLTSSMAPNVPMDDAYANLYGVESPYARGMTQELATLLMSYRSQGAISRKDLEEIERKYQEEVGLGDIVAALWENGLLGVERPDGSVKFRYETPGEELMIPLTASSYRLHPVLRAALSVS